MLAYVFWHRPQDGADAGAYEQAQLAFHRSLAHTPPVGLRGTCAYRVAEIPWLGPTGAAHDGAPAPPPGDPGTGNGGYEDWYLLADFTALGVLNEAAVGRGHRTSHDRAASHMGAGAGGVYGLIEGDARLTADPVGEPAPAIWVSPPPRAAMRGIGELLGDGMDPRRASLWRRHLALGPAPEFCLMAREASPGVASSRLPERWTARLADRTTLYAAACVPGP
jgi:hypothetical protein